MLNVAPVDTSMMESHDLALASTLVAKIITEGFGILQSLVAQGVWTTGQLLNDKTFSHIAVSGVMSGAVDATRLATADLLLSLCKESAHKNSLTYASEADADDWAMVADNNIVLEDYLKQLKDLDKCLGMVYPYFKVLKFMLSQYPLPDTFDKDSLMTQLQQKITNHRTCERSAADDDRIYVGLLVSYSIRVEFIP